jgi:hypothetical protein
MVTPAIPAPNYGTLDNTQLGQTLGNLPADYQKMQLLQLAQQQEQMQLEQAKKLQGAFAGGLPMQNGQPSYAEIMQRIAQAGDPALMAKFAPLAMEQQQITQAAAPLDPSIGGGGGGGTAPAPSGYVRGTHGSVIDQGVEAKYITDAAKARGIDPDVALRVAKSEGLAQYEGDEGSSFGPYQLHYGGVAGGGNAVSGLGDRFTKQTGLNARDPSTWRKQVDFALDTAAKEGWGAWHGWKGPERAGLPGEQYASRTINDATPRIPVSAGAGSALTPGGDVGAAGVGVRGGRPGSIAAMINLFEPDPNKAPAIAGRFAKSLGIDQNADLTPELAQQAQKRIGEWAQRTGRQPAQAGGGQQMAQAPTEAPPKRLTPQVPLPFGLKPGQEEQAISGLNKQIEALSANPYAAKRIAEIQHQRDRIEKSLEPVDLGGERYAATGEKLTHRMGTSPQSIAFENFMAEHPNATAEQQVAFIQKERPPRNPTAMIMDQARQEAEAAGKPFGVKEMRAVQRDLIAGNRGASSLAVTAAQLDRVEEESKSLIPRLEAILPQLDHKKFKTINGAIDAYSDQVGDPTYLKYKLQVDALAALWARTKKGGTPTGGETDEARHEIDSRWSKGGMQAVLDQYKVELQTMQEGTGRALQKWGVSLDDAAEIGKDLSADRGGAQSGGGGWTTLPNGARIREKP